MTSMIESISRVSKWGECSEIFLNFFLYGDLRSPRALFSPKVDSGTIETLSGKLILALPNNCTRAKHRACSATGSRHRHKRAPRRMAAGIAQRSQSVRSSALSREQRSQSGSRSRAATRISWRLSLLPFLGGARHRGTHTR
jgi:hypothetical protein